MVCLRESRTVLRTDLLRNDGTNVDRDYWVGYGGLF
jgi:hypothetical protein